LGHTKDFKNDICCFSYFNAQHLRVAQRIKKQLVDYMSTKEKLIHSWRYKTLAVIKRHKNHLSFFQIWQIQGFSKLKERVSKKGLHRKFRLNLSKRCPNNFRIDQKKDNEQTCL